VRPVEVAANALAASAPEKFAGSSIVQVIERVQIPARNFRPSTMCLASSWTRPRGRQTMALEIEGNMIRALYVGRNPDKLRHLAASASPSV